MKKSALVKSGVLIIAMGIVFFPVNHSDSATLSEADLKCGREGAYLTFENIIERALIKDIAVTHKEGGIVYATGYTFLGLPLSKVAADCDGGNYRRIR